MNSVELKKPKYYSDMEKWYITVECINKDDWGLYYLHSDGIIRLGTQNLDTKEYTGFYDDEHCAAAAKLAWEMENS